MSSGHGGTVPPKPTSNRSTPRKGMRPLLKRDTQLGPGPKRLVVSGPQRGRVVEGDRSWLLELLEAWLEVDHNSAVASSYFLSRGGGRGGILPGKEAGASETVNDSSRGVQARASKAWSRKKPRPSEGASLAHTGETEASTGRAREGPGARV